MSKATREERLEFFNALCEESSINFLSARNQRMVLAIHALIEHGPKVSREFVAKYECAWKHWQHQSKRERDKPKRLILAMLTELGHEVEVR